MSYLEEASIYVGTYAKYNNGSIAGKWLKLEDYESLEEFHSACKALHHDEEDPELMFQDWEYIPAAFISESWIDGRIFDLIALVSRLNNIGQRAFSVWLELSSHRDSDTATDILNQFEEEYCGEYESEEDFAMELVAETYDLPYFAQSYFNYQKFAHDLFLTEYYHEDGFVFRRQ